MTSEYSPLDDVIDLRKYISLLLAKKWWIIAVTLVFALFGFGLTRVLPEKYQSTSIAAVTQTRNQLNFDPRIETIYDFSLNYQSYATLAESDSIILELFNSIADDISEIEDVPELRGLLDAEVRSDLILLNVQASDPVVAENVANLWVEIFVNQANRVYGSQDAEQITFFETQMADAQSQWNAASQSLVEFQARNRENILHNQLNALNGSMAELLYEQQSNQILLRDILGLISQLEALPANQPASQALQVSALLLQNRAYGTLSAEELSVNPLQVQVGTAETTLTIGDQILQLDALRRVVDDQLVDVIDQLAVLEPQITENQKLLQETITEKERLTQTESVSQETLLALSRKVDESRISSADTSGQVRLASYALPSREPVFPSTLLFTAAAGAVGFILAVVGVIFFSWWRLPKAPEQD
jgi:uncharacterized protein involved in exopolysaccharide biosynthesis